MANILVLGASGGIGLECVKALAAEGHAVRAMSRHPEAAGDVPGDVTPWPGDATDRDALRGAVAGMDAVVMALGVSVRAMFRPVSLFSEATAALIPEMEAAGVTRLVAVTGFGAGDAAAKVSGLESIPFKAILGRAYADKGRQETLIKDSRLDWTIVRPGILTNGSRKGRYQVLVTPESWRNGMIARADVADFIARAIAEGSHVGEAPVLVY
jgi:uncharacterized protein YbjT (DUF2867 family)